MRKNPFTIGIIALTLSFSASAQQANDDPAQWRWFDVEVLVFKHTESATAAVTESFPWLPPAPVKNARHDLLRDYYVPNFWGLLFATEPCDYEQMWATETPQWLCHQPSEIDLFAQEPFYQPDNWLNRFEHAPVTVIDGGGGDMYTATTPLLMPARENQLNEMRSQLERRNVGETLLHVTYRQPVFGQRDGYTIRLFGGKNYGHEYLENGYQRPPEKPDEAIAQIEQDQPRSPLFAELEQLLQQAKQGQTSFTMVERETPPPPPIAMDTSANSVWQLDGLMHVYLVGNYLHINSQLQLREPEQVAFSAGELASQTRLMLADQSTTPMYLRRYDLEQLRRVISHETHYFDHPKFGLVVQIRRTELSARR